MRRKRKKRGQEPLREYDKATGEYRPVSRAHLQELQNQQAPGRNPSRENGERRVSSKYRSPQARAEYRRKRRKRRLIIFYICIFLTVLIAAVVLSLTVLFKIDTVEVAGETRYSQEEIIQISEIVKGENLFLTDTKAAAKRLSQKLPYLNNVKVTRSLPAKIVISVEEAQPSGALEYDGQYLVVSKEGKALEFVTECPENVPLIKGMQLSQAEPGKTVKYKEEKQEHIFTDLTATLSENEVGNITEIDLNDSYKIMITYDNRIKVNLGLPSDFDYKIRFFLAIMKQADNFDGDKGTLDLSAAAETDQGRFEAESSETASSTSSTASSSSQTQNSGSTSSPGDQGSSRPAA